MESTRKAFCSCGSEQARKDSRKPCEIEGQTDTKTVEVRITRNDAGHGEGRTLSLKKETREKIAIMATGSFMQDSSGQDSSFRSKQLARRCFFTDTHPFSSSLNP
jgi:hypothetical protein